MSRVSSDTLVAVPDDVIFRELDGEAIILDLAKGLYFGLDEVGTRAWMLLAESSSVGKVIDVMSGEFDVDRSTLERDVLELVTALLDKGLVRVTTTGGPGS
jgi:hypothetical protein